ncbi:OVARIAN TUMOR DOMAIN-containing deubiquitinating enzyme 9 [Citrus sinensis]|uniref:OVARIAN TUMOR DOMAIN-containing deubiquitinating enzyme 9 n=1 Tax=Citrus sinensis TaxID=2711 RepID=A0ACB8L4U3_CITSI|nr:OVARIAN TUMOR DOMAIN-containing deubiquitinating enzyme 9 [Citrus sinensis]
MINMITYEQDPDVLRWGLHQLLDVCTLSNSGSQNVITRYDRDSSQVGYVRECYSETEPAYVEDDEVIAHVLQEEFSQVTAAEASGSINPEKSSILEQDRVSPLGIYNNSVCENDQNAADGSGKNEEEMDDSGRMVEADYQSKGEKVELEYDEDNMEDLLHQLDTTDESSVIDGELGKRLNQMVPVPHIPKINGDIPSPDEEISDHQRMLDRLQLYDLVENKVQGDGNCQFRSLSDQLYRSPEHHMFVRQQVVNQLKAHPEIYEGYVPMAYSDYLKKMNKSGEWGDHVTLQAAADSYGVKVFVLTSFKDTCYIEILPHVPKSKRVIFLSFWAEVHYNSIYPEGDLCELIEGEDAGLKKEEFRRKSVEAIPFKLDAFAS